METTPDQARALEKIFAWHGGPGREFRLGGLAGTGKTWLMGQLPNVLGGHIEYAAPTGRAASVLAAKTGRDVRTVHSLLKYAPSKDSHEEGCTRGYDCVCEADMTFGKMQVTDGTKRDNMVIVVDEASMVNSRMYEELCRLGAKLLFVGDYGQLPPVGESGFSIVHENALDAKLGTIVRQAEGDPIISLAWDVRSGKPWPVGLSDGGVRVVEKSLGSSKIGYEDGRFILCYTNKERIRRNTEIRGRRGLKGDVVAGDVVICLRNDPIRGVYNGQRGVVEEVRPGPADELLWIAAMMESGVKYAGYVVKAQFNNPAVLANEHGGLFDFGYAMTVHKAQGSEAASVVVLAEKLWKMDSADVCRWRYTAVTRAKKNLLIVVPPSRGY